MDRIPLLDGFLEVRRKIPHAWGTNDCGLFVADWVWLLTGVDPAKPWRGQYDSEAAVLRIYARDGGIEGIARKAFGEPIAPALACYGDIVLGQFGEDGVETLAICLGAKVVGPSEDGILARQMKHARLAWHV